MPTPVNTEIANQSKVDVVINSTSHTERHGQLGRRRRARHRRGQPVLRARGGRHLRGGGYWTDVKVKEKDLPSLVGTIGLPLSRRISRAPASRSARPPADTASCRSRSRTSRSRACRCGTSTSAGTRTTTARSRRRTWRRSPSPSSTATSRAAEARSGRCRRPGSNPRSATRASRSGSRSPSTRAARARAGAAVPAGRRRGQDREPRRGRLQPELRDAPELGQVRRLLLAPVADPRLQRREPGQPGPHHERAPLGRLPDAGRRVLRDAPVRR